MFRSLLLILLLGITWQASTQEDPVLQWTMRPLGTENAYCAGLNDLAPASDGGVVVVGDALAPEFGCWTSDFHDYMFYVSKLDSFGRVEWELALGDTIEYQSLRGVIALDSTFIVAGFSEDQNASLDGSPRQFRNLFLSRVNNEGDTVWTKTIPNICDNIAPIFMQALPNQQFLVATEVFDSVSWQNTNQARIIQLDANGNILQESLNGTPSFSLRSLETTIDGKIVIGGFTQEVSNPNRFDFYLEKFELGSAPDWFRYYSQFRFGYIITALSNGSIIGWGTQNNGGSDTTRLAVFNFLGLIDTIHYYEGEDFIFINDLVENTLNSLVTVGNNFCDNCPNSAAIMGFNQTGSFQWSKNLNLPGSQPSLRKIVKSREGVFYVLGKSAIGSFRGLVGRLTFRSLLPDPEITGPIRICTFSENTYTSNYPDEADQLWELAFENTAGDTLWIQQFADTSQVFGYGLEAGTLHICNTIYNELDTCISVQVGEDQLVETSKALCGEECFQAPDGSEICEEGTYPFLYSDSFGCDSTVLLTIERSPAIALVDTIIIGSTGSNDGSIAVNISGGTPPLSFSWNNGASGSDINDLNPGDYLVTVSDALGCTATFEFSVPLITPARELLASAIQLSPNPVRSGSDIQVSTSTDSQIKSISFWHSDGNLDRDYPTRQGQSQGLDYFTLPAPNFPGVYLVQVELENGSRQWLRLLVQ